MNKTVITLAALGACMAAEPALASSSTPNGHVELQIDSYGRLTVSGVTLSPFDERMQAMAASTSPVKNVGCGYHCRSAPSES